MTACMSRDFVTGSAPHNDRRPLAHVLISSFCCSASLRFHHHEGPFLPLLCTFFPCRGLTGCFSGVSA